MMTRVKCKSKLRSERERARKGPAGHAPRQARLVRREARRKTKTKICEIQEVDRQTNRLSSREIRRLSNRLADRRNNRLKYQHYGRPRDRGSERLEDRLTDR